MSYPTRLFAISVPLLVLGLVGCSDASSTTPDGDNSAAVYTGEVADVRYLTSFNTFGRDAYVYVAEKMGYFDEVGIDVTIEPGTGSVDVLKLVASGSADFGIADFSATAVTVANEALPITAIGAIQQLSLAAIVALEGNGIENPQDLEGKSIADQPGSTNEVIFPSYAEAVGIDPETVTHLPAAPPTLPQVLASGQADAIGQFVVGEPLIASVAGDREVVVLPYGDVLPDLYGNVLVTSDTLAEEDPDLVERFTSALMRGLEYSIAHPEETGDILVSYQPTQDADVAAQEVELMAPYVEADGEIGGMTPERVDAVLELLAPAFTGEVTAEDLVSFDLLPGGVE